jgi:adenosylcobinamide kinase/adenosylcobinamide-phosphate guanylyltransferase
VILVGGGVRSGKSDFAIRRALATEPNSGAGCILIATGQALDEEMTARIEAHRRSRPASVRTIEAPIEIVGALDAAGDAQAVVIDCLTLWVSNLLMAELDDAAIRARFEALTAAVAERDAETVLVTNEVGMGIVPADPLSRRFRDLTGVLHASIARVADEVYLGAMGLLLRLKPGPVTPLEH